MGCLNKCVEEEGIMVCGEGTEEVDDVSIEELGCGVPDEAGEVVGATHGESGATGAKSVCCTEVGTGNGAGGEAGVEPGVESNDWKTHEVIQN
jgi:hypothetical protein